MKVAFLRQIVSRKRQTQAEHNFKFGQKMLDNNLMCSCMFAY